MRTLVLLCCVQLVLLPTVTLADLTLPWRIVAVLAWSAAGWAVHVPQQSRLAQMDPPRAPVLLALHSAAIYVGSSVGSALAAAVLRQHGYEALGPAGAVLVVVGLLSLAWSHRTPAAISAAAGPPQGVRASPTGGGELHAAKRSEKPGGRHPL
jgi:predicted MFS family arabinose efflux permease